MTGGTTPADRPGGRAWFLAAAGTAGALLAGFALLLDRALAPPPSWEGPLGHDAARREYLPRCTSPLVAGRPAALELYGSAPEPVTLRLHVRTDEGRCLGEREIRLGPGSVRRTIAIRPAVGGPHTFIWEAQEGSVASSMALRVRRRAVLPVLPVAAGMACFAAAGMAGLIRATRHGGGAPRARAVSSGALLGFVLALAGLLALRAAGDPLVLQADGPVEIS